MSPDPYDPTNQPTPPVDAGDDTDRDPTNLPDAQVPSVEEQVDSIGRTVERIVEPDVQPQDPGQLPADQAGFPDDDDVPQTSAADRFAALEGDGSDDITPPRNAEPSGIAAHIHVNIMIPEILDELSLKVAIADYLRVVSVGEITISSVTKRQSDGFGMDAPNGVYTVPFLEIDADILMGDWLVEQTRIRDEMNANPAQSITDSIIRGQG